MGVAHLIAPQTPTAVLVDQCPASEPVIDDAVRTSQRAGTERHASEANRRDPRRQARKGYQSLPSVDCHTVHMTPTVSYGADVPNESELRLCGDVQGKRVIELGIDAESNAPALARAGARVIVVDPSAQRIAAAREAAAADGNRLEAHPGDLADLGFATSASVDLVLCVHRLDKVDDLARTLRQVHRVLKPDALFVLATAHPAGAMFDADSGATAKHPYRATGAFTLNHLFTHLQRSNFQVDALHELFTGPDSLAPTVLVLRTRKLGV